MKDVDVIADVQTNRSSFGSIETALVNIGFDAQVPDARTFVEEGAQALN